MPRMAVIPPGIDFSNVVVQDDIDGDGDLAALTNSEWSSPKAIPAIWSEMLLSLPMLSWCLLLLFMVLLLKELMLNILAQYRELSNISDSLMIHRGIEALKNTFAIRMSLADPDFVNVTDVLKDMLWKEFAEQLRKTIFDNTTFNATHYGGSFLTGGTRSMIMDSWYKPHLHNRQPPERQKLADEALDSKDYKPKDLKKIVEIALA